MSGAKEQSQSKLMMNLESRNVVFEDIGWYSWVSATQCDLEFVAQ